MININTVLTYPISILVSIGKRSFENLGRSLGKSGDTASRLLQPAEASLNQTQNISRSMFKKKKKPYCIIDDTLVKKIFSLYMQGAGMFFDTKARTQIMAYRLVIGMISDGKLAIPIDCAYLFSKELTDQLDEKFPSKEDIAKKFVLAAKRPFPEAKMIICADGLYATEEFIRWCKENKMAAEMRMHSNRVIVYMGNKIALKGLLQIKGLKPKGRKMARTITAVWYGMELEIAIVRRIDKKGDESIVFQCATYKASPKEHVEAYSARWYIEKCIRTAKQNLGLQDCFSRSLKTQHNHVAAVLLAYALTQLQMKTHKIKNPECAIRRLKSKNIGIIVSRFLRMDQIFG